MTVRIIKEIIFLHSIFDENFDELSISSSFNLIFLFFNLKKIEKPTVNTKSPAKGNINNTKRQRSWAMFWDFFGSNISIRVIMAAVYCCCCCIITKIWPCLAASCCWCRFFKASSSARNLLSFSVFPFRNSTASFPIRLHLVYLPYSSPAASDLVLVSPNRSTAYSRISPAVCLPQSSLGLPQNLWILLPIFLDLLFHQLKFQVRLYHLLRCH